MEPDFVSLREFLMALKTVERFIATSPPTLVHRKIQEVFGKDCEWEDTCCKVPFPTERANT